METSPNTPNNGTTPSNQSRFNSLSLQERKEYAAELMKKNKGRVPVILSKHKGATIQMGNENTLLVISSSLKVMNFTEFIRRHFKLPSSTGLFLFVGGNTLVKTSDLMGELYIKWATQDSFLHITVSDKEMWG